MTWAEGPTEARNRREYTPWARIHLVLLSGVVVSTGRKRSTPATTYLRLLVATSWISGVVICGCASEPPPKPPPTWDGLELVEREGLDSVYVRPGASLVQYKRVMLRHAEVSFDANWMPFKDPVMRSKKVDPNRIARDLEAAFNEITVRELEQHSYAVVSNPDDDVLRVVPNISDLFVRFADPPGPGEALVLETGHMMLVAELRDSMTNTVLARVVDRVEEGNAEVPVGSGITGNDAAKRIITKWAVALRTSLDRAHALPPPKEKPRSNH